MNAALSDDSMSQWLQLAADCQDPATVDQLARVRAKQACVLPHLGIPAVHVDPVAPFDEVEARLDAVMEHLGIRFDPVAALPQDALRAIAEGREIDAVYAYRRANGSRMVEALRVVRSLMAATGGDDQGSSYTSVHPSALATGPH